MIRKIVAIFLLVIIGISLCSCEVYVKKEDTGKYYLYDNNVKTDTWIEFKKNQSQWQDSDGNRGIVEAGSMNNVKYILCSTNNKTGQLDSIYTGYLFCGVFSFYKASDLTEEGLVCRDFYSDKAQRENKDSSPYSLSSIVYSTTCSKETERLEIYELIRTCYVWMYYPPFEADYKKDSWMEEDILFMRFMVRDCDEVRELAKNIASDKTETAFMIKDGDGNVVLTAKDFDGSIDCRGLYSYPQKIIFTTNQNVSTKITALYDANPSVSLQLFIFNKYVRDLPITAEPFPKIEKNIEVTGEAVGLLAKDVILTQKGIKLSLMTDL